MDPEEIAKMVKNLKLSQVNQISQVTLPPDLESLGKKRLESCLVGKIFSSKAVNRNTFRSNMPRILQAIKAIDIEMVGENLFLLNFKALSDKKRALLEGPWNFFKDLVLFAEPHGLQNPNEISFLEVNLWVQFHNLPIAFMQPEIMKKLGDTIGKVIELEGGESGFCSGRFGRIRILKRLDSPLDKGICVNLADSKEDICIVFLYEKLPNFCFACGRLGHVVRDCEDDNVDKISLQFGNWLRAPPLNSNRRGSSYKSSNSESKVPSEGGGGGEASELTPVSQNDNYNPLCENLQLSSVDVNLEQGEKEENTKLILLRDVSTGNKDFQTIHESIGSGAISISDVPTNMEILANKPDKEVRPDKQFQGSKQWKRLARGMMPLQQISAEGVLVEGDAKRPRESEEIPDINSKKSKASQGFIYIVHTDSAVAAV